MRRRILHVYQSPSFSGAEAYAKEFAEYHHTCGHYVCFLVLGASPLASKLAEDGKVDQVSDSPASVEWGKFDTIILHSTQELRSLKWRLWKLRLLSQSRPLIVLYSHIWISHSKRDPIHAIVYSLIDQFWCSSKASQAVLKKLLPISQDKIKLVRYGRHTDLLQMSFHPRDEARNKLGIPLHATVFGTLARVDEGKGSRELWNSAITILNQRSDVHFLMIGPPTASDPKAVKLDAELSEELIQLRRSQPEIAQRMTKLGRLENGTRYLKAFDLFVLATYKENFALSLLEAQLAGVPCLGTDSGGTPDLIEPPNTGWTFPPSDQDQLTQTIDRALGERNSWSAISRRGQEQVLKNYGFNEVMKEADRLLFDNRLS